MKYYARKITKREAINRFGKLGFVPYIQAFKTNKEQVAEQFNKGKKIKFTITEDKDIIKMLRSGKENIIVEIKGV